MRTETSSFSYGDCFLGAGPNITVADGALSLKTRKETSPVTCKIGDRTITSNYTSGSVTSLGKFSQAYGRFEIRAAMPASSGKGLQSALWLVPDVPSFYGAWPYSGEIDVVEYYTQYPDRLIPALHYGSTAPFDQRTNNACLVYKPTEFHTYVLEWTKTKLKVTIDGTTCVDHAISPLAPLLGSAPFDKPFNLNLTQMLGSGDNALPAGTSIDEATMKVDYVRVWK
ncbi:MAG: glycoside hydrolase family 16 protein [Actinomycetales bacterium]|nr:MAG: glycoside hydrolase family 16 protein [Actinomycetales bacterium]